MREAISINSRVAMSLQRLETRKTLCNLEEVYGMAKSTI